MAPTGRKATVQLATENPGKARVATQDHPQCPQLTYEADLLDAQPF